MTRGRSTAITSAVADRLGRAWICETTFKSSNQPLPLLSKTLRFISWFFGKTLVFRKRSTFSQQKKRPSASHEDLNFDSEESQMDDNQATMTDDVLTICCDKESIVDTLRTVMFELFKIIEQKIFGDNQDGQDIAVSIMRNKFQCAMIFVRPRDNQKPFQLCVVISRRKRRQYGKPFVYQLRSTWRSSFGTLSGGN